MIKNTTNIQCDHIHATHRFYESCDGKLVDEILSSWGERKYQSVAYRFEI